jgi:hypothetical protein
LRRLAQQRDRAVERIVVKYVAGLVLFTCLALLAWPYLYVYRLDAAIGARDLTALQRLVDLKAVRAQVKTDLDKEVDGTIGSDGGRVGRWLKQGIKLVSDSAIDANIDMQWVMTSLSQRPTEPPQARTSLIGDVSYAFFEAPDRFIVRLGELGAGPVHVQMDLQEDRVWRVVAIYAP